MPQDISGKKVLNRYKIVEKIGGGGMSVVWKAYDLVLDRNVALKILRPEMSEDDDFIRRFRREAQSVASLSHPNIVNIYDVGEDQGLYFIVMELIGKGETLRDYLRSKGRLPVERALSIAAEICEALSHAHGKRIIHRDIKPQNILLTEQGHAKVADFGIARALGSLSTTTRDMVVGSAPYISPEQAKNGMASVRSDLYSLGVVLYEMLSGKQPFAGDSPVAVALQHVEADAPPLRENVPSVPTEVDALVKKAMAKDPLERFQSAEEMLSAVRAAQASLSEIPSRKESLRKEDSKGSNDQGDANVAKGKGKKLKLSFAMRLFLGLAVLTLIAGGAAWYALSSWFARPEVTVPDVVGKPQIQAMGLLKDAGLIFAISGEKFDETAPAGTVLSQSPLGGEKAKQGREVWCLLSKGQDYARVPNVVGKAYPREVLVELQNAGVEEGEVEHVNHPTIAKGLVISQKVPAYLDVPKGTPVGLVVSLGPEISMAKVPTLVGTSVERAEETLSAALLDLGVVVYQQSTTATLGTILSQDPAPEAEVPLRTKVNLIVAGEAPAITHTYTKSFNPADVVVEGQPTRVIISVTDAKQTDKVVYDMIVQPNDLQQTVTFQWQGSVATVRTNIGGRISTETIRP